MAGPAAAGDDLKALVVAFYCPPFGGGASVRVHNFIKYLPAFGVTPCVLTVSERYYEELYHDPDLVREYPAGVELHRTGMLFGDSLKKAKAQAFAGGPRRGGPFCALKRALKKRIKALLVPDEQIFWFPAAFLKGRELVRSGRVSAIVATAPPFSSHLLGAALARAGKLPLILDYRDLWTQNPFMSGTGLSRALNRMLERRTVAQASKIVCTNRSAADALTQRFQLAPGKAVVIENGFDGASLYRDLENSCPKPAEKLRINYLGSLTTERTPRHLLAALKRLVAAQPLVDLELGFVGFVSEEHRRLVDDLGLASRVRFYGTVSKAAAQEIMCRHSDVLVVLQRRAEGGATAIPGKVYEYLATGKPVLTMDEGCGATTLFLRELGVDFAVDYDDEEGILGLLSSLVHDYQGVCRLFSAVAEKMPRYDRRSLTGALASLVKECAHTGCGPLSAERGLK